MHGSRPWHLVEAEASMINEGETLIAQATLDSEAGYAQKVRSGHHAFTSDEPVHGGGTDTGPPPFALVLAGLGSCTAITLRMYAQRKGWELGSVHLDVRMFRDAAGIERIVRTVRLGAGAKLSDEQRAKLAEIAEKTPVTRTIKAGAAITTKFS
jgi:putative redox protein